MVTVPRDWVPAPEQMALMPSVSGNAINGLGETKPRPPRVVYWAADPATIPHGAVQRWFYTRNDTPELAAERQIRMAVAAEPLPDLAADPVPGSPADWSSRIKAEALRLGAEAVGIAAFDPAWLYQGAVARGRFVIMLGFAMDYATMQTAPDPGAGVEVVRQYTRGMRVSRALAGWMRRQGHEAVAEPGPMTGSFTMIPAALAAGMGELGKHGSVIHRRLGSMFRMAAVLTDLELVPDAPDDFGGDDFCTHCRLCSDHCPPDAIFRTKQTVRGVQKWYVDFDRCLPFFNETAGCAICLAVCPFSHPDRGPRLAKKLERRRALRGPGIGASPP
jgi:epoxyqueuosine reductase